MINERLQLSASNNPLANRSDAPPNSYGLMESELLLWLATDLNFTYDIIIPADVKQLGTPLGNGNWTGVLGQIMRGEADLTMSFSLATLSRSQIVDQTFPIFADNLAIMIPYPEMGNNWNLTFSTSSIIIISSVIATLLLIAVCLWLVHRFKKDGHLTISQLADFVVSVSLYQGGYIRPNSSAFRFIHGTWLVALFFAVNLYSGMLTSVFMAPQYNFLVRSVEELAANEKIMPIVIEGSPAHGDLFASSSQMVHKIVVRIQQHPELLFPSQQGGYVTTLLKYPYHSDLIQGYEIQKDFKKMGYCRALTLDKFISTRNNGISLRKNSRYTSDFNRRILLLRQSGLPQNLENKYKSRGRCSPNELLTSNVRPTAINLSQFRVVFLIPLIGCVISFIVFICEIIYFHWQQRHRYRQ